MKEKQAQAVSLFQRPLWVAIFALTAAVAWGWAYPLIKLGFKEFAITPEMTGSKMLFAGVRFCLSGLIILAMAKGRGFSFRLRKGSDCGFLLLYALFNTTFHYAFFYFGLSHSEGARAAILNTLSVFTVVILACLFFKSDKLTLRKILGCLIGFLGILALNLGGEQGGTGFTWLGDGMIILNALSFSGGLFDDSRSEPAGECLRGHRLQLGFGRLLADCARAAAGGHVATDHPVGIALSVAVDRYFHHRLLAIQQAAQLQSRRESGYLQLLDTNHWCAHLLSLLRGDLLHEIPDCRCFGYLGHLFGQ